jgi:hypothetical protein
MPEEFLVGYGVQDLKRERRRKLIALTVVGAAVAGLLIWYVARTFREERTVKQFVHLLEAKDYAGAYALWGCTPQTPCRDYKIEKFTEDWGAASPFANAADISITIAEPCGNSVWVSVKSPKGEETGLSVDAETRFISYAPEARCPGKWRLREFPSRLWKFIKERF